MQSTLPIVALSGELDLYEAPALRARLDGIGEPVALDFSAVTYLDSSTLNELVRLRKRVGDVVLVVSSPQLLRVLEIVGFTKAFRVVGSREDVDA